MHVQKHFDGIVRKMIRPIDRNGSRRVGPNPFSSIVLTLVGELFVQNVLLLHTLWQG